MAFKAHSCWALMYNFPSFSFTKPPRSLPNFHHPLCLTLNSPILISSHKTHYSDSRPLVYLSIPCFLASLCLLMLFLALVMPFPPLSVFYNLIHPPRPNSDVASSMKSLQTHSFPSQLTSTFHLLCSLVRYWLYKSQVPTNVKGYVDPLRISFLAPETCTLNL